MLYLGHFQAKFDDRPLILKLRICNFRPIKNLEKIRYLKKFFGPRKPKDPDFHWFCRFPIRVKMDPHHSNFNFFVFFDSKKGTMITQLSTIQHRHFKWWQLATTFNETTSQTDNSTNDIWSIDNWNMRISIETLYKATIQKATIPAHNVTDAQFLQK